MSALASLSASRPRELDAEHHTRLAVLTNRLEVAADGLTLPSELIPAASERTRLVERLHELEQALTPAGPREAHRQVVGLLLTMRDRAGDPDSLIARQRMYAEDLKALPVYALEMACNDYRRADIGDGKWLPSPGELIRRASLYTRRHENERASLVRILNARPLPRRDRGSADDRKAAVARIRASMRSASASGEGGGHHGP